MYVLEHPTRRIFRVPPVQPMDHNQHTHNSWNTTATNFFRLWSVTYTYVEWLPMYKIKKDTTKRKLLLILTGIYFPYDVFSFYVPYIFIIFLGHTYIFLLVNINHVTRFSLSCIESNISVHLGQMYHTS